MFPDGAGLSFIFKARQQSNYVAIGATPKMGRKTIKMGTLLAGSYLTSILRAKCLNALLQRRMAHEEVGQSARLGADPKGGHLVR